MPNNFFKFKQFIIFQDQCAMKVGTLGCILGAYATHDDPGNILDVGTGTGLLSLMMAQKYPDAFIDAVEIDAQASSQANANFKSSQWSDRIRIHHTDFLKYPATHLYDLILSNPPFFENHQKSPDQRVNIARHDDVLPIPLLLQGIAERLTPQGMAYLLLPEREMALACSEAASLGMISTRKLMIRNFADAPVKAVITAFQRNRPSILTNSSIIIRGKDHQYTKAFRNLLRPYYLHF